MSAPRHAGEGQGPRPPGDVPGDVPSDVAQDVPQDVPGAVVVYGVPLLSDRVLELPDARQRAVFDLVALREAVRDADRAGLQSRPVGSAHAEGMVLQTDGEFDANVAGQRWSLHVPDEISFHWVHGARAIDYEIHDPAALADFTYWSVHLVLPMFLALEGIARIVHGGCVTHGEDAVLFIGPSAGGKSTTVDAFLAQGHGLVADDKLPLRPSGDGWQVVPSHPMHRPWRARRDMGQPAGHTADGPRRLAAVYALAVDEAATETTIAPLTGQAAVGQLLQSHLFQLRFLRADGLAFLGRLAREVPMFGLRTPKDLERLPLLRREVLEHLASLGAGRGA